MRTRPRKRIAALATGLLIALGLLEGSLWVAHEVVPRRMIRKPRHEVPAGDPSLRIACVGDSFTYGYGLPRGEDYPSLRQRYLRRLARRSGQTYRVFNEGVPGINTAQIRHALPEILQRDRPHVVLFLAGFNNANELSRMHVSWTELPWWMQIEKLLSWSRLFRLVKIQLAGGFSSRRHLRRRLLPRGQDIFEDSILPLDVHRRVLREDLDETARLCRDSKARLILQTYPSSVGMCREADDAARELAEREGLLLVDHASLFQTLRRRLGKQAFVLGPKDVFHLNQHGNQILVENLLASLSQELPGVPVARTTQDKLVAAVLRRFGVTFQALLHESNGSLQLEGKGPPGARYRVMVSTLPPPWTSETARNPDSLLRWSRKNRDARGTLDRTGRLEHRLVLPAGARSQGPLHAGLLVTTRKERLVIAPRPVATIAPGEVAPAGAMTAGGG